MILASVVVLAAVAMLIFVLRVNRRDRREIEALVQENGRQEADLVTRLEQARAAYDQALQGGDRDQARRLGETYYACKTDYDFWAAPPMPLPDDQPLSPEERRQREEAIERDNAALRSRLQAENARLLEQDLMAMTP